MAFALAGSFFRGDSSLTVSVFDPDEKRGKLFSDTFAERVTVYNDMNKMAEDADLVILAVKVSVQ